MGWLNGPLVWAIDDQHQPMYLFPRDCPRILLWRRSNTTKSDADRYLGDSTARMIAYVEERWLLRIQMQTLYRYSLPTTSFQSLDDAGMWVSRTSVIPTGTTKINCLPIMLKDLKVELRVLEVLSPLRDVWNSTVHASGIRLRNAHEWET